MIIYKFDIKRKKDLKRFLVVIEKETKIYVKRRRFKRKKSKLKK